MASFLHYFYDNNEITKNDTVKCNETSCKFEYPCKTRTICTPITLTLDPGKYYIKLCGARGGHLSIYPTGDFKGNGGNGGCAWGTLYLKAQKQTYLYLGGIGFDAMTGWVGAHEGGWNGGGWTQSGAMSGGGASDLRLIKETSNKGLRSRIMVAGGGGGSNDFTNGGSGGGISGGKGQASLMSGHFSGDGGNQIHGGQSVYPGTFGMGSSLVFDSAITEGGSGGGGYFGGARGNNTDASGGGGSGYVSGMSGCWSVPDKDTIATVNNPVHYSKMVFKDPSMSNGENKGPGYAIVTQIEKITKPNIIQIKRLKPLFVLAAFHLVF